MGWVGGWEVRWGGREEVKDTQETVWKKYDITGYPQMAIITLSGQGDIILAVGKIPG